MFTTEGQNILSNKISDDSFNKLKNEFSKGLDPSIDDLRQQQRFVDAVTLFIQIQNMAQYCDNAISELNEAYSSTSAAKEVYESFISVWNENIDKALIMKSAMANYYLRCIKSKNGSYGLPTKCSPAEKIATDDVEIKLLDKIEYADQSRKEGSVKRFFVTADDWSGMGVKDELTKFTEDIRFTTTSKQNKGGIRMCSSAYNAVELKDGKFEPIKGVAQFSDLDGFKALIKRKINSIK